MNRRGTLTIAVLVGAIGFGAGRVFPQDKGEGGGAMSGEDLMKLVEAKAALADEHRKLAKWAGSWEADGKFWTDPSRDPNATKGASKFSTILGGRYVLQEYAADFLGRPFEGRGIFGYDRDRKKHFNLWIDNMRTGYEVGWEVDDGKPDVLTFVGDEQEWEGVKFRTREVFTPVDADHTKFERWTVVGGEATKEIEILYTRKK